jgi:hypothetical protein
MVLLFVPPASARFLRRSSGAAGHGANTTLRKRLHINDLITEPGTVEIDWGSLYSYTSSNFSMPSAIKYTPEGGRILWGRTEYSAAFDSVTSALTAGERTTQFSDRLTFTATAVVLDTPHFDIALAPQATFFLRDESGGRYGTTLIARADVGRNSLGATVSWTAATAPSENNPSGSWDFGGGYGRHLGAAGILSHVTPHANAVLEKSTGFERTLGAFVGVEYQITDKVAVDVSGQRFGWIGPGADRQFLIGMTVNLGKPQGGP